MLSPEVLNFNPPRMALHKQNLVPSSFKSKLAAGSFGHSFKSINLVTPGIEYLPDFVCNAVKDHHVYIIRDVPIHRFLDPDFISAFVKKGDVIGASLGTLQNIENSAKLEAGKLKLSVTKETYQEFGLVGKPKEIVNRATSIFEIEINLNDLTFSPSSKLYQRTVWCLKDRLNLKFDWIMAWNPLDEDICGSSLAAYWDLHEFSVEEYSKNITEKSLAKIQVPTIDVSTELDFYDLLEWVGAASLEIKQSPEDLYVSSWSVPEPCKNVDQTSIFLCNGIFGVNEISRLVEKITILLNDEDEQVKWTNLTIHGTENEMVSVFLTSSQCTVCRLYKPTNKIK